MKLTNIDYFPNLCLLKFELFFRNKFDNKTSYIC